MDKLLKFNNKLIKSGNRIVGKYGDMINYYEDSNEYSGVPLNLSFTADIIGNPNYVAAKLDFKSTNPNINWAFNRTFCGIRCRYMYNAWNNNAALMTAPNLDDCELNEEDHTPKHEGGYTIYALNTNRTEFNNIKYIWNVKDNGFSGYINDIWRYRDNRTNDFNSLSNFSCTVEQQGSYSFNVKNIEIAGFNELSAAEQW